MKNTRGFLLAEETLKIIIAVICLALLAYFLVSVYLKSSEDEDLELAKASLEHLISEAGTGEVEIYNPDGWVIISWPQVSEQSFVNKYSLGIIGEEAGKTLKPLSCENLGWEKCICICKGDGAGDCDKNGVCRESVLETGREGIKIKPPLKLKISDGKITK